MGHINAPCCEACWISKRAVVKDGEMLVPVPVRITQPDVEVCHYCGAPTIFGCYIREAV